MAIIATYVSATEFTVSGDHSADLAEGQKILLGQGVDGETVEQVVSVSYSGGTGLTTVTVQRSNLTSNLATVKVGLTIPESVAIHNHTDEESGGYLAASSLSVSGANKVVGINAAGNAFEMKTVQGTAKRVIVNHTPGNITLTGPQDLDTVDSPEFAGMTLTGLSGLLQVTAGTVGATNFETLDGDHLDVTFTPSYYTPATTPAEAADVDDLAAHLYGIDQALGNHDHDSDYSDIGHHHDSDYADIDGDHLDITFTPAYYTPAITPAEADDVDDLAAHLYGIDQALAQAIIRDTQTAGEALAQYDVVYSKTTDSGEWWLAQNDGTEEEANARAIVVESGGISDGSTGELHFFGFVTNGSWTWTPGAKLFVGEDGAMTETEPESPDHVVQVAQAITATKILFAPGSAGGGSGTGSGLAWKVTGWIVSTSYYEYDALEHDGTTYICIQDHTATADDEPGTGLYWDSYWDVMAEKGDAGAVWDWQGPWALSSAYYEDDGVENDGDMYICTADHTSTAEDEPGTGTYWESYWDLVVSGGGTHAANHVSGGSDEIDGDGLDVDYSASNYTAGGNTLADHLGGIDTALGSVGGGGGGGGATPDYCPPEIRYKDADEITVSAGRYYKGGYRWRGQYKDTTGLASYWDVASPMDIDIDAVFSSGSSSGMLGGGKVNGCPYGLFLLGNTVNDVVALPMFRVGDVDYNVTRAGKTTVTFYSETDSAALTVTNDSVADRSNWTQRIVIEASELSYEANKVRVTLQGQSSGTTTIDNVAIVERLPGTAHGVRTPTELLFSGGSGTSLVNGAASTSDWTAFVINPGKDYLVILDINSDGAGARYSSGGTCYSNENGNSYNVATMPDTYSSQSNRFWVDGLETKLDYQDLITQDDDWNTYRLIKLSNGEVATVEDSEENSGSDDDVAIDGDEVNSGMELAANDWLQVVPPSGTDCCYLGAIVLNGDGGIAEFIRDKWLTQFAEARRVSANASTSVAETTIVFDFPPTARRISGVLWVDTTNTGRASVAAELYSDASASFPIVKARATFGDDHDNDRAIFVPFSGFVVQDPSVIANRFITQESNDGTEHAAVNAEIHISAFEE